MRVTIIDWTIYITTALIVVLFLRYVWFGPSSRSNEKLKFNFERMATMERLLTDQASDCMACEKRIKELEAANQHLREIANAGYLADLLKNQPSGDPLLAGFPAVLPPKLCTSCGHQFEPGAKYCRQCGTSANKYQLIDNVKTGHKYKQAKAREDNGWPLRNDQKEILRIVREADLKRQVESGELSGQLDGPFFAVLRSSQTLKLAPTASHRLQFTPAPAGFPCPCHGSGRGYFS